MIVIHSLDEIPHFADEEEEHRFWSTHDLSEALMDQAEPVPDDELPPPRAEQRPHPLKRAR